MVRSLHCCSSSVTWLPQRPAVRCSASHGSHDLYHRRNSSIEETAARASPEAPAVSSAAAAAALAAGIGLRRGVLRRRSLGLQGLRLPAPTLRRSAGTTKSASSRSPGQVHVLSACNTYRQETVVLERSAAAHGYQFRAVGLGEPFLGVGTKLMWYDRALKELVGREIAPEDPVMLLDAWDTVILAPAEELREKLKVMGILEPGGSILCAADRICAPEYKMAPKMERLFPDIRTPWRYPNSGGIAGTAAALRAFLHSLVHGSEGGGFTEADDDQLRVQTFLHACQENGSRFPFRLDEDCSVFQNMGEFECGWDFEPAARGSAEVPGAPPRIRNWTTGERPIMAHGCGGHGRWFLADIYRELDLLGYLGIDRARDLDGLQYAGLVAPGEKVCDEHWVEQPPWEFPFQAFEVIRSVAFQEEEREAEERRQREGQGRKP
ncbi:unnamed protein product [Polarella glacialis]|uniref:PLOD1-3-like GT domain-containing protein n=1 Tax=Polarella glacialis TaxID=89957 RepID=A0A813FYH5_POLGL|nr:unnamed protein product [Polarella glacialis]